jgi:trehalose/maltose hydrolase-like predicted phosphorylase
MARWNIERGLEVASLLGSRWPQRWRELRSTLRLEDEELRHWQAVSKGLVTGFNRELGLFEQFEGFFSLERVDVSSLTRRAAPADVLLGRERTQRSQVVKQADVLMLIALLNAGIPRWVQEHNFDYYEPLAAHGSSLSPAMHGLVAARLGRTEVAHRYFEQSAAIDLDNTIGNAAAGVHIGALGGLWQLAVLGFGGVDISGDQLRIDPRPPASWQSLEFPLRWRGRALRVRTVAGETVTATLERGRPLTISLGAEQRRLRAGETWTVRLRPSEEGRRTL